jgi:hypothetical protein
MEIMAFLGSHCRGINSVDAPSLAVLHCSEMFFEIVEIVEIEQLGLFSRT